MHSKAKLALAVLTSPGAAFEEILERRLLGTGLVIVAIAGTLSLIGAAARTWALGPIHHFVIGRYNPIAWFGLYLLYAFAVQKLLKWIGTEIDYVKLLIIMGWAQVALVIVEALAAAGGILALAATSVPITAQHIWALSAVLMVGYAAVIAVGIRVATGAPTARGFMTYTVIAIAGFIAFSLTYGNSRIKIFVGALPGVSDAAQQAAESDATAWIAAAAVGLALGAWHLGKELGWSAGLVKRNAALAGAVGALAFGGYLCWFVSADYYGKLLSTQRSYDLDRFDRTARDLRALIPASKIAAPSLTLDVAEIYLLSGKPDQAIVYFGKFQDMVREAKLGKEEARQLSRPQQGIGAAYYQQGRYDLAIKQFELAAKAWPEFRDPWVRLAVTYDRMGDYRKAVERGEHAIKKLGSQAAVAYVALAQAYAQTGDAAKAKAAFEELKRIDDDTAKRIGDKPEGWKSAVGKLTARDLKFPLEKEIAPRPERPGRKGKPTSRR